MVAGPGRNHWWRVRVRGVDSDGPPAADSEVLVAWPLRGGSARTVDVADRDSERPLLALLH